MNARQSGIGRALAVIGALLQIPLLLGVLGSVWMMIRVVHRFNTYGVSERAGLPVARCDEVLPSAIVSFFVGLPGFVLLCIALVGCRYRAQWFFSFLVTYACVSLLAIPLGTGVGIFVLVYCIAHRREFGRVVDGTPNG